MRSIYTARGIGHWGRRALCLLLAAGLCLSLVGCSQRSAQGSPSQAPKEESPAPAPQPEAEPLPPSVPEKEEVPELPPPEEEDVPAEPVVQPANPAAVTDFGSYAALDGSKLGWGPGGPVDELNRSQGALAYQEKYGGYDADFIGKNEKVIYLTFDQGYENGYTAPILDTLKEKGCKATFFLTGHYVNTQPELIQRMIDEGHTLGNHSQNHPSFPDTPLQQCKEEVEELHNSVKEQFGYEMGLFRFPAGEFSEQDLKLLQDMGYRSVFWSFAYRDWLVDQQPDPTEALETICSKAHPGAIMLLHSVSSTNAQILGEVIDRLRDMGYELRAYEPNLPAEAAVSE